MGLGWWLGYVWWAVVEVGVSVGVWVGDRDGGWVGVEVCFGVIPSVAETPQPTPPSAPCPPCMPNAQLVPPS